ncbi:NAD-dependent epimerase/dehydratase family protein [Chloroflexota bacterium]
MSSRNAHTKIFVSGATGFIGKAVVYALLEAGAQVTALIPPNALVSPSVPGSPQNPLNIPDPEGRLRQVEGDVWHRGSLSGRSRGHQTVIHLIGSTRQNPEQGQTYQHLNVVSTQNIARMTIGDGVPRLIFLSAAGAPWLPRAYIQNKRAAERYLQRSGARWTTIRAPLAYPAGRLHNPLLLFFSGMASIPIMGRPFTRWAPLPVDVMARGIAQLALDEDSSGTTIYGRDLRRYSRLYTPATSPFEQPANNQQQPRQQNNENTPFGWLP